MVSGATLRGAAAGGMTLTNCSAPSSRSGRIRPCALRQTRRRSSRRRAAPLARRSASARHAQCATNAFEYALEQRRAFRHFGAVSPTVSAASAQADRL